MPQFLLHCCGTAPTVLSMNTATSPQDGAVVSPQVLAGRTLRMMRQAHRVGLREMAAAVDISPSHLSRIESGERPATGAMTQRICDVLATLPAPEESA